MDFKLIDPIRFRNNLREETALHGRIAKLKSTLEFIRDTGGETDRELGISCNGKWCAEQARRALEETG